MGDLPPALETARQRATRRRPRSLPQLRPAWETTPEANQPYALPRRALDDPNTVPYERRPTQQQVQQDRELERFARMHELNRNDVNTPPGTYFGQDTLEMTGAPALSRGMDALAAGDPGRALPEVAIGGASILGWGFGAHPTSRAPMRPPPRAMEPAPRLPNAPARLPGRATDGSVLPIRPPEPIRQSMVGGSDDLAEAAAMRPAPPRISEAPDAGSSGARQVLEGEVILPNRAVAPGQQGGSVPSVVGALEPMIPEMRAAQADIRRVLGEEYFAPRQPIDVDALEPNRRAIARASVALEEFVAQNRALRAEQAARALPDGNVGREELLARVGQPRATNAPDGGASGAGNRSLSDRVLEGPPASVRWDGDILRLQDERGSLQARALPGDSVLRVDSLGIATGARGTLGPQILRSLLAESERTGRLLVSDTRLSGEAVRAVESLRRLGLTVTKTPDFMVFPTGSHISRNGPLYVITRGEAPDWSRVMDAYFEPNVRFGRAPHAPNAGSGDAGQNADEFTHGPLYHGTRARFDNFDVARTGENRLNFVADREIADRWAGNRMDRARGRDPQGRVIEAYARLRNPQIIEGDGSVQPDGLPYDQIEAARAAGHDGVILRNFDDAGEGVSDYTIVFDQNNVRIGPRSRAPNAGTPRTPPRPRPPRRNQ